MSTPTSDAGPPRLLEEDALPDPDVADVAGRHVAEIPEQLRVEEPLETLGLDSVGEVVLCDPVVVGQVAREHLGLEIAR